MNPKLLGIIGLMAAAMADDRRSPSNFGKISNFGYATPGKAGQFEKKVAKNKRRKQLAKMAKRRNRK